MENKLKSEMIRYWRAILLIVFFLLCIGWGYFFGRFQQIELNRAPLKVLSQLSCVSPVSAKK